MGRLRHNSFVHRILRKLFGDSVFRFNLVAFPDLIHVNALLSRCRLHGKVLVAAHCVLDECEITSNAGVSIGEHSILTGPIRIVADLNSVHIGRYCSIAPHVSFYEALHDYRRISTFSMLSQMFGADFRRDIFSKGQIFVGNDVWIGTRTVVLTGITIGNGAIVAAGSVVTRDVAPFSISGGVPAKHLGWRFDLPIRERLQQLRWWDWPEKKILANRWLFERELTIEMLDQLIK
jgi:virginiamycin A acetyltransferase